MRRIVEWDTPRDPVKTAQLDEWMTAAATAGARPLLAIEHSWTSGRERSKPTIGQYTALITWLRSRYPSWNTLSPWNEANFRSQPTAKDPKLAAKYWTAAKKACKGCVVTSPVILAWSGAPKTWIATFQKATKGKIRLWAVHVYGDHNRGTDLNLRALEKQLPGTLWVTEAAGWVKFLDGKKWPYSEARAAKAIDTIFRTAKQHKARVKRWYFYQWRGPSTPDARWDSGVLNPDGSERSGFQALRKGLRGA